MFRQTTRYMMVISSKFNKIAYKGQRLGSPGVNPRGGTLFQMCVCAAICFTVWWIVGIGRMVSLT